MAEKLDAENLKAYMKTVYQLEAAQYMQRAVYQDLDIEVRNALYWKQEPYEKPANITRDDISGPTLCIGIFAAIMALIMSIGKAASLPSYYFSGDEIGRMIQVFGFLFLGGIIGSIIGYAFWKLVIEKREQEKYTARVEAEQKRVLMVNKRRDEENARKRRMALVRAEPWQEQMNDFQENVMKPTSQALQALYSLDILHPKYRDLVAVSSIYGYLDTGRCTQLEGHEGAYNIYEDERLQKIIISKLDDVINRLDRIEQNQYMLYRAIQYGNAQRNQIMQDIRKMSDDNKRHHEKMEQHGEAAAYYSRMAAQNTEAMLLYDMLTRK